MGSFNSCSAPLEPQHILIIGNSFAGKSSVANYLRTGSSEFTPPAPTLVNEELECIIFKRNTIVIDTSMYEWQRAAERCQGVIYVLDASEYNQINMQLQHQVFVSQMADKNIRRLPVLILGNKIDIPNCQSRQQLEETYGMKRLDSKYKFNLSSTKTGDGIRDGMQWLTSEMKKNSQ